MQSSNNHSTVHVKMIILATILLLAMSGQAMAISKCNFSGGGTEENPYQIETLNDLKSLSESSSCWDKNFIQTSDINVTETSGWNSGDGFSPIGNDTTKFTGSYDGGGYTIDNLFINRPSTDNVGLFGYTDGATIENVGLTSALIAFVFRGQSVIID